MKFPLVMVALCYAGGIVLAEFRPLPFWPVLSAGVVIAITALVWERARPWLLVPLLGATGAANVIAHSASLSPRDLRTLLGDKPVIATLRGQLVETPYQRVRGDPEDEQWRSLVRIRVSEIQRDGGTWEPAWGQVMASTPGLLPDMMCQGHRVEVNGVLKVPSEAVAEGLFDYRSYLRRLGVHYQLSVRSPGDWLLRESSPRRPLANRFASWARKTLAVGLPEEDKPLRLLWAMTLGWKTGLGGEVAEPFMRSGTMHIFAISGLHVALISGILVSLLRLLRVPRAWCGLIVIPLLWGYTFVTGWQASAVRSTVMMSVVILGWSLRRPHDLLNSLAAAAFLILLWDPQQLFQAGFQLSFFVVLSLALFEPVSKRVREAVSLTDPLLPRELAPPWKRWPEGGLKWLCGGFLSSLAAWLGSIPLVALYFHLITPVSLLANVLVVPLSGLALASDMASLLVGGWWPWAAGVFNHSAWWWMSCMIEISEWFAGLPGAWFHIESPSPLFFVGYYGLLVSATAGWLARGALRRWISVVLVTTAVCWVGQRVHFQSMTRLTVVTVGGGDAIYFEEPRRRENLLIDGGNESSADFVVKPYLASRGVNRLTRLVVTHGDLKHFGGVPAIEREFDVETVLTGPVPFRSPGYRALQRQWRETRRPVEVVHSGDGFGGWQVLHPDRGDHPAQADDAAIVLLGTVGSTRILLLSDLSRFGQNSLMNRQPDLRADIVVSGLPTDSEPLAEALLDAIQPRVIVISDAEYPASERASARLRDRLAARGAPVILTREARSVIFEWRGTQCELRTANGLRLRLHDLPAAAPLDR